MDARTGRTRSALEATVIALAQEAPIQTITVSSIAAAAHVNRSTFYEHAESPAALLRSALRGQLVLLRQDQTETDHDRSADMAAARLAVVEHIAEHRPIYAEAFSDSGDPAGLLTMLAEHFSASASIEIDAGHIAPPPDGLPAAMHVDYVAMGIVGAIRSWLGAPDAVSAQEFADALPSLHPAWFTGRRA